MTTNLEYVLKNGWLDEHGDGLFHIDIHKWDQPQLYLRACNYLQEDPQGMQFSPTSSALVTFQGTQQQWSAFVQAAERIDHREAEYE